MRIPRHRDRAARALLVLAALGAFVPRGAGALGGPASGGTLRIAAEPSRLVLGNDAQAELRVDAPSDLGDLSLTASIGRIESLRPAPGGGWAARFRPPPEHVPAVAIVTALGRGPRGTEHGFVAIPLSGQGDARVRGAPGSPVSLRIGDRTFGPRTAGKDGVAVIPVVVPPGIREAHRGFKAIDLHVPDTPLLHAVLDRSMVRADREELVHAFAYVVAPHGAPRRGDVPAIEPSRGTVAAIEGDPGAFDVTWTLPPGRAGEERLSIRLPAAPASRAVLKLAAVAGPPALVAITFDRDALVAGSAEPVHVVARALDAGGNPVPAEIALSADGGSLTDRTEPAPGRVEAVVGAGPAFRGRRELVVTATAPGAGISGSRALTLRSGEPAVARFAGAEGAVLRADGKREVELRVGIEDAHGNPVEQAPRVSAERGRVAFVAPEGRGAYVVRYVGPAIRAPTEERLVAQVGTLRARTERLLVPRGRDEPLAAETGIALDLRGRFAAPIAVLSAERSADAAYALRRGFDVAWRGEVWAGAFASGAATALLAGTSAAREVGRLDFRAIACAGAFVAGGDASPALRMAAQLGAPRTRGTPFVEAALLAAGGGAPGAFAAFTVAVGLRFGGESER
jgi:hypothetical protein